MTDGWWNLTRVAASLPLGYAAGAAVDHIPHLAEWQQIIIAICAVLFTLEYAEDIRERKRQHRDP